jgi:hypothetical protein
VVDLAALAGLAASVRLTSVAALTASRGSRGRDDSYPRCGVHAAREACTCSHSSWPNRRRGIISIVQKR